MILTSTPSVNVTAMKIADSSTLALPPPPLLVGQWRSCCGLLMALCGRPPDSIR